MNNTPIVSVDECRKATISIRTGLTHVQHVPPEAFLKCLDVLDSHDNFYEIAFESEFQDFRERPFLERGFPSFSTDENKSDFAKNLQALLERLHGRVRDPKIILAGFLLGKSAANSLELRDRAKRNPLWLEHAILDEAPKPRELKQPDSPLSVVMNVLLSGVKQAERDAFWDVRPEGRYVRKDHSRKANIPIETGFTPPGEYY